MSRQFEEAVDLHRAGRLEAAAEVCRQIIDTRPGNADALHLLGVIAQRTGQLREALSLVDRAIDRAPAAATYHRSRGIILQRQGRLDDAVTAYDQALRLKPDYVEAQLGRGSALQQRGRLDAALGAFDQALQLDPDLAAAHLNCGVIFEQRAQLDEALDAFDRALEIAPNYTRAHVNRGVVLQRSGRPELALAAFDRALGISADDYDAHLNRGVALMALERCDAALDAFDHAVRVRPERAEAHFNRGTALTALERFDEALRAYDQAVRNRPNHAEAHFNRGGVLERQGSAQAAVAAYDRALKEAPDWAAAHVSRGKVLRGLGRLDEALAAYDQALRIQPGRTKAHCNRGNVLSDLGRFADAAAAYRQALEASPDYAAVHSNLLFSLNYDPAQDRASLFAAHRDWGERHGRPANRFVDYANPADPDKTLRVGLVSADFVRHPVGYLVEPLVRSADPAELEIVCYAGNPIEDELTERLKVQATDWRPTLGMRNTALAEAVRADGIDVLIDLAGHTANNRLAVFALKPAPVQVSWIGYPNTTGLPAIDHILMDEATVPAGDERWFVEHVVRLPSTRFCYAPPDYAPEPGPPPMLTRGWPTFGSFNNLTKLTPSTLELWARLLRSLPEARLVLKWKTLGDPATRARYLGWFEALGVDPERVELRAASKHRAMLAEYADIDIALDPMPYSGGTTSLEALWQAVPVVTLPGDRPVSRQTMGFLSTLDRTAWIATSADAYVRIAIDLARDPGRLARLRQRQRMDMASSPLCDGPRFAAGFQATLRQLWRHWCERQTNSRQE